MDNQNENKSNIDLKPIVIDGEEVYKPESIDDVYNLAKKALVAEPVNDLQVTDEDKLITALRDEGISEDDINVFIDIKKGNKGAVLALMQQHNLKPEDIVDVDDEENIKLKNYKYTPNNYIPNKNSVKMRKIYRKIGEEAFNTVVKDLDDVSKEEIFEKNPEALIALKEDIDSGIYQKIKRHITINKNKGVIDKNADFLYSYITTAKMLKEKEDKIKQSTKSSSTGTNTAPQESKATDLSLKKVAKMSDEDFLKYFNKKYKG
jgi:hypothetical protein